MEENVLAKPRPSAPSPSAFADRPSYKWWVTWTIMLGSFLFALDSTIVNIAIPKIMTSISADLNQIQWVLIIYMIGMAVVMPAAGWLSDLLRMGSHGTLLEHFSAHISLNQSTGDSCTRRSRHVEITRLHGLPSVPMPCGLI